jgi:uncharacterized protein (TIGR04255 family)
MIKKSLKNKPLVEAIFELRWSLEERAPGIKIDPHYRILVGRIYDRIREKYAHHEQLSAAALPDEIAGYLVQHRFRKDKDQWPLIQVGPGIITLNDTEGYSWEDFKRRISLMIDALFESYPDSENLEIEGLLLRYIDSIEFNYKTDDIFKFLKEKMKMNIVIYPKLFEGTGVGNLPLDFNLRFSFSSENPRGSLHLKFARGRVKEKDSLVWETMFQSMEDVPKTKKEIIKWTDEAHRLTHDWFFKIIEGELERRFE